MRLQGVSKHYGPTAALDDVTFSCFTGEIHAILGENGAGKSTLMKIMSGVVQPSAGDLLVDGKPVVLTTPKHAINQGLICMFQELSLVPDLSVRENLLLGEPGNQYGFSSNKNLILARDILDRIDGTHIGFSTRVRDLPLAERQQVEIAKAMSRKPRLLILDEATSALNASVVERVFDLLREAKNSGIGILFISHRFHEIEAIAGKISVFRNGKYIDTFANGDYDYPAIINKMVGKPLTELFPTIAPPRNDADIVLEVNSLCWSDEIKDVSLQVRSGEIIGLGGLDGQGQNAIMQSLFGLLKQTTGTTSIHSNVVHINSPKAAKHVDSGLAWVPEDRKTEGLILAQTIQENLELAAISHSEKPEIQLYDELINALELSYRDLNQKVSELSGGNQQKVALIKWLVLSPRCLLLSDPTRGIDVKTKTQIYGLLKKLAESGMAIIFLSTDYEELINLCSRVHVFYDGAVVDTLSEQRLNAENIIAASLNVHNVNRDTHV